MGPAQMYATDAIEVSTSAAALDPRFILSSIVYAVLGIVLMLIFIFIVDQIFKIDLKEELFKDQNTALGIWLAGVSIAIAIIIASAIH